MLEPLDVKPIVIFTIGTQGDVRPCVALGQALRRAGYPVRIATSKNFTELVRNAGLDFHPVTADFQGMLEANNSIGDHGLNLLEIARIFREQYTNWAANWVEEGLTASEGAGLLIGVSNSILLAKALSEARGIPFAIARLQPVTLSKILPPIMFSCARKETLGVVSLGAHYLMYKLLWDVMRPAINGIVRPQLRLKPYPWYGPYFHDLQIAKTINGFSTHVLPRPADWTEASQVTGYWFLDQPRWSPSRELQDFLDAGPKPVYVGFGSMVAGNAATFTETVLEGVKQSGRRAVLATGWGALNGADGAQSEQVFFLRQAPHDYLFPLMAGAVHHGGAGTIAASVRAGIPSVVVPFFGDQPFWAHCLYKRGVAPPALERKTLTPAALASALKAIEEPQMLEKAATLGYAIRAEDGAGAAVRWLRDWNLLPRALAGKQDVLHERSQRALGA
jgi:UDP:flavonoid glycosyltransferase YjiC (YdhE family)